MTDAELEQQLLASWEDVHKMGQLTLWIMLALKDGPKHMAQIRQYVCVLTNEATKPEEQSLYRSLRRYCQAEMIDFTQEPSKSGPEKKVYKLTPLGARVLSMFTERNITPIYYSETVKDLINRKEAS